MVGGQMVMSGSIKDLVQEGARKWMIEVEVGSITDELFGEMSDIQGVTNMKREGAYMVAESDRDVRAEISEVIFRSGVHLLGLRAKERSLDEIYMKYFEET